MATKKKAATKRKAKARGATPKAATMVNPTLVHIHYHPEVRLLRATVQKDVSLAARNERAGRDLDFKVEDLPDAIKTAVDQLFTQVATFIGVTPLPLAPLPPSPAAP
jgi:hypothetical protein